MRNTRYTIWIVALIGVFLSMTAFAQESGDYRSAATGNWSELSTWEIFDGDNWIAATDVPTGTENITVHGQDTVTVDTDITITGYVTVTEDGQLTVDSDVGSLEFGDGSTYEHAQDAGSVPIAVWGEGSTFLLTGTVQDAPGNRNQSFYNVVFNTPDLGRNRDMGWNGVVIGGDVHVISTGANRWQMSSVAGGDTASFAIMGDVIVEDGQFAVQGTGNALTVFEVSHYGDIIVTGGNFSIARGSQGSGSGSTLWYLYEGNFVMSDATTQNSNSGDMGGVAKFIFAKADTQSIAFTDVTFGGGRFNFDVSDSTIISVDEDLSVNGDLVNYGEIIPVGELTIADGGVYEHARNGGSVPTAVWAEGSTALFTGITTDAPGNRGQDYYNLTLNTPDLTSNRDLSLDGNTIGGDIHVISTGLARWQLVGGSSGTVTIMGDVIVEDGQFASQGTGSATDVVIDHYGNIIVTGGNFSVSRGSQGGTGTTSWYLHEGDFSMSEATTQNSNPEGARFIFAKDGVQLLTLTDVNYGGGGMAIEVAGGTTLDFGSSEFGGNGLFILNDNAALATAHVDGIAGAIQTTGDVTLSGNGSYIFNGTEPQVTSETMPDTVRSLTINNDAGVTLSQETLVNSVLRLIAGVFDNTIPFTFGPAGYVSYEGGSLLVPLPEPELPILVDQWGFMGGRVAGWQLSVGEPGNYTISGDEPMTSGWSAVRGGFTPLMPAEGQAFVVTGQIETVGQGLDAWNAMRYGIFRHDNPGVLEHAETDSARWSGVEGQAYGYLMMTMSGTNEKATWGIGGAGDIGAVYGGSWISTFGAGSTSLGVLNQRLFRAIPPEGLYDFAISVHTQEDGYNQVRFYLTHENGEYWFGGIVIDTTGVPTPVYNSVVFGLNADSDDMTAAHFMDVAVTLGDPITLPAPPLEVPPHEIGRIINENRTFELSSPGVTTGEPFWTLNAGGGSDAVFEIVTGDAQTGDRALMVDFGTWNGSANVYEVEAVSEPFYPEVGDNIRATVWLRADQEGRIARIYLGLPDSGGWQRVPDWNMEVICTLTTEWQLFEFPDYTVIERDIAHADSSMRFGIEMNLEGNDGGVIYIDNAIVRVVPEPVSVEERPEVPLVFALEQNYPNPFNPTTQIQFSLPERADVLLEVYDILGRKVATLINNENYGVGYHTVTWNATNQTGRTISSGMYIYRLQAGDFVQTKRMMFLK
jgi:hypothetical protein